MKFNNNNNTIEIIAMGSSGEIQKEKKSIPKIALLALLFGMGSWIAITGLWLEMPLLIQKLPEGWRLASHLNIMIQFANIGPLIYWFAHRKRILNEISATHIQLWVGMASCALLIIGWDRTWILLEHEHSVVLFVATFGLALVDCTSSVTFLPFMARFDSSYMTPYLVGEGLSGFIPSMVALLQGVGEDRKECSAPGDLSLTNSSTSTTVKSHNLSSLMVLDTEVLEKSSNVDNQALKLIEPRFSVEIFFFSLLFTILISYVGFCALQFLPVCRKEMKNAKRKQQAQPRANKSATSLSYEQEIALTDENTHQVSPHFNHTGATIPTVSVELESIPLKNDQDDIHPTMTEDFVKNDIPPDHVIVDNHKLSEQRRIYYYLLVLMCWNCFTTFGFFPSVQPYSALPYGVEVLHYVVVLSGLAYPAGCFFGMLVENKSVRLINLLTITGSIIGVYILTCALMSPTPPLVDSPIGGLVMIVCWICFVGILSYAKTMITLWICDFNSRKGMFWVGMNTQFGAAAGALLNFILINYSKLFNEC